MLYVGDDKYRVYVGSQRMQIMQKEERPLWIEIPAGSVLNTGLYPTTSYKIVSKFFENNAHIWGSFFNANSGDNMQEFSVQHYQSLTNIRRNINTSHYGEGGISLFSLTTLEYTKDYHIINGTTYSGAYSGSEISPANPLAIGGKIESDSTFWAPSTICYLEASIYDGDTLLRHYIPAKKNGVYCFEDTVSGEYVYPFSTSLPFRYEVLSTINRSNVLWKSGNIAQNGTESNYANQITNFIVLPKKGCFLSLTPDSNYTVTVRTYDDSLNPIDYNPSVTGGFKLPPECRVIRLVLWDKPSASYVANDADFELEVEDSDNKYFNPVLRVSSPDPTVWDGEDGYYYMYCTGALTKTMYRSSNLVDWEDTGEMPFTSSVASEIQTAINNTSFWAPCVFKVNNTQWNMYLCKPYGGIVFLTSSHPTHGYTFVRYTTASFNDYIDPDVAVETDGTVWMFAGSAAKMFRRQMTSDALNFAEGSEWVHVAGRPSNESGNTNRVKTFEGEYLYRRDGYWYLFCSSGQYSNSTYALRVVRSATLNGTFVDKEGNLATDGYAETILSSNSYLYGPGHNSQIIVDNDNKTWMLYHSHWIGMSSSSARPMCLDEVLWDNDGWPYFEGGTPTTAADVPNL